VSFDNYMQHDAHEFLNYLLNTIADLLQGKKIIVSVKVLFVTTILKEIVVMSCYL